MMIGDNPGVRLVLQFWSFYRKESDMDKMSKILFILWMVLAVASFVAAWFAPLWIAIIGWVFGAMNITIILAWASATIRGVIEVKNNEQKTGENV